MQNKNKKIIMGPNMRFSGLWDIIVFIFAEHDLFKPTTFLQSFIKIDFHIILTLFSISRDRNIR